MIVVAVGTLSSINASLSTGSLLLYILRICINRLQRLIQLRGLPHLVYTAERKGLALEQLMMINMIIIKLAQLVNYLRSWSIGALASRGVRRIFTSITYLCTYPPIIDEDSKHPCQGGTGFFQLLCAVISIVDHPLRVSFSFSFLRAEASLKLFLNNSMVSSSKALYR